MGEQSNAYRILLRYDRKSRHRRIKKRRRYERLAATSQFRNTHKHQARSALSGAHPIGPGGLLPSSRRPSPVAGAESPLGVARTLSPPQQRRTHTLASVETGSAA